MLNLIFGLLIAAGLSACAVADGDGPNTLGDKLQEGLHGQGKIVPNNATQNSFGPEYQ